MGSVVAPFSFNQEQFKMNTVAENYWLIYAAAMIIRPHHEEYYFQSLR